MLSTMTDTRHRTYWVCATILVCTMLLFTMMASLLGMLIKSRKPATLFFRQRAAPSGSATPTEM
jgi:hypothetical protein